MAVEIKGKFKAFLPKTKKGRKAFAFHPLIFSFVLF